MKAYKVVVMFLSLLFSCHQYPKDPEKTWEKVKNNLLLVGYSENPPWVVESPEGTARQSVGGIEVQLIEEFAARQNAEIQWIKNSENELFQDLIDRKLHIVITGLTTDTPWKKEKIGITRPFFRESSKKHVMAVQEGENAFLIQLEKFLLEKEHEIRELVKHYENNPAL